MAVICTSNAIWLKAGAKSKVLTDAQYTIIMDEAEAFVNASSRYDWSTNWASVSNAAGAKIAKEAMEDWAAMNVVSNDMSVYTSRLEAQTILDVLWSKVVECINLLRSEKHRTFAQKGEVE